MATTIKLDAEGLHVSNYDPTSGAKVSFSAEGNSWNLRYSPSPVEGRSRANLTIGEMGIGEPANQEIATNRTTAPYFTAFAQFAPLFRLASAKCQQNAVKVWRRRFVDVDQSLNVAAKQVIEMALDSCQRASNAESLGEAEKMMKQEIAKLWAPLMVILNSIDAAKDCSDFYNVKISYIDLLSTSSERQQQLKEQYYFVCSCSRCNDDHQDKLMESFACSNQSCEGVVLASSADDDTGVCETCDATVVMEPASRLMQQIKWQLEELDALQKSEDFSTLYERCTDLIKKASGVLHPLNIYYVRLLEHAFDSTIQLENWPQAIEFGHACSRGRSLYYHAGHPALTYHFAKVGKILQYMGQLEEAEKYLQQALDEAKLSHGDKHRLYVTIGELFSSCREERRLQLTRTQKLDK